MSDDAVLAAIAALRGDVTALRGDVTALRAEVGAIKSAMAAMGSALSERLDVQAREQERLRGDVAEWMERLLQKMQEVADDARVAIARADRVADESDTFRREMATLRAQMLAIRDRLTAVESRRP